MELKDQANKQTASELFLSQQTIYKNWDYRCLVPYSHPDPEKWRYYDMHAYRNVAQGRGLTESDTFDYDHNFNNWIDPTVLEEFIGDPERAWRKSYGFPFVRNVGWDGTNLLTFDAEICHKECARLVGIVFNLQN